MALDHTKTLHNTCSKQLKPHILVSLSKIRSLVPTTIDANAITDEENNSLLQQCLIHGCCKSILKYLVKSGALINHQNIHGETALHLACKLNNHHMIKVLLMLNSDTEIKDRNGLTALDIANNMHDMKTVEILLKHTIVNPDQNTIIDCLKLACNAVNYNDIHYFINNMEYLKHIVQPLHVVCSLNGPGSVPLIQHYLEYGAPINCANEEGLGALHVACKYQETTDVVKFLLFNGASANKQDNHSQTPLFYCLENSNSVAVDLMIVLIQHKADPSVVNINGDTALRTIMHKHPDRLAQILSAFEARKYTFDNLTYYKPYHTKPGYKYFYYTYEVVLCCLGNDPMFGDVNKQFVNGNTYLHYACLYNATKFVEYLVKDQKADPNCQNAEGNTPLHLAAAKDNESVCHVLCVNKGTDLFVKSTNNETVIVTALREGSEKALEVLMSMMGSTVLENGKITVPCMQNLQGNTFLHYTVLMNQYSWMEYVMYQQCKDFCCVNIPNNDGNTPLHLACIKAQYGRGCRKTWCDPSTRCTSLRGKEDLTKQIVQCLLNVKSDVYTTNNDGLTPLACAFITGNTFVFRILADYIINQVDTNYSQIFGNIKKSINTKSRNRYTLLVEAIYYNKSPLLVEAILKMGADFTIPSVDGCLPLHIAAYNMNKDIIDLLLKYGENINRLNQRNKNALYFLCDRRGEITKAHVDMVKYLVDKGIYVQKCGTTKLSTGLDPLVVAVTRRSDLLTDILLKYGANPNVFINEEPILYFAVVKSTFKCVSLLLHYGADVRYTNQNGLTALDVFLKMYNSPLPAYAYTRIMKKEEQDDTLILLVSAGCRVKSERSITIDMNNYDKLYTVLPSLYLMHVRLLVTNNTTDTSHIDEINNDIRNESLSLKLNCAKVIRTKLRPNALVRGPNLPVPKSIQNIVTLNYIKEN